MVDKYDVLLAVGIIFALLIFEIIIYWVASEEKYKCIETDGKTLKVKNTDGCKWDTKGTWKLESTTNDYIIYKHS